MARRARLALPAAEPMSRLRKGGPMGRGLGSESDAVTRRFNRRRYDAARQAEQPWRAWYKRKAWKRRRSRQLTEESTCRIHRLELGEIVPANTADHIEPHNGDWEKFWRGELQSLCSDCHNSKKQREEFEGFSRAMGADGFPLDPRHPFAERKA